MNPSRNGHGQTETPAVAIEGLEKTYGSGDTAVTAVDGVSFEVEQGSVVGLLGPNGAGKTTVIKSALGLLVPTAGRVEVMGVDVHADTADCYRQVGAMLEGARNVYWRLTPRENLRFFAALQGLDPRDPQRQAYHRELLESLGLAHRATDSLNDFSRGMKQKVALACTLARETPVVFLDEPTLGLDVSATRGLRERITALAEEEGRTVVLSSHDMDVVQSVCDRAVIMNDGWVVADDDVDGLVELFQTRAYEVTVGEDLDGWPPALKRPFDAREFEQTESGARFTVTVPEGRFYEFTDQLREAGLTVERLVSVEPDLEEAFVRLTGRETTETEDGQRAEP